MPSMYTLDLYIIINLFFQLLLQLLFIRPDRHIDAWAHHSFFLDCGRYHERRNDLQPNANQQPNAAAL